MREPAAANLRIARAARSRCRADDLLRDATYRRLWTSILISSLGGQVTMLALPLTAAVLLHATPTQMGLLTAMEIVPFVLFSLPRGVWLDRVRKLPVYVAGEARCAVVVASVPLAWWLGWLSMPWLYVVGFVDRQRLHDGRQRGADRADAGRAARAAGRGACEERARQLGRRSRRAGPRRRADQAVGAPLALLVDAVLLLASALILRGIRVHEVRDAARDAHFWRDLSAGLRFVAGTPLLVAMAAAVGVWQMCHHAAIVVQILFATRVLGLSEQAVGLCFVGLGVGTVLASLFGNRISRAHRARAVPRARLRRSAASAGCCSRSRRRTRWGVAAFALMLMLFGVGAVLIFINFLALRQAVTPAPLLGRMTSTMRWLILLPAGPGALLGGWLGEHVGLRAVAGLRRRDARCCSRWRRGACR